MQSISLATVIATSTTRSVFVSDGNAAGTQLASVPTWVSVSDINSGNVRIDARSQSILSLNAENTFTVAIRAYVYNLSGFVGYSNDFTFDVNFFDRCYDYVRTETPVPTWPDPMVNFIEFFDSTATVLTFPFDGFNPAL